MKLSPDDRRLLDRMAPGALCRDGFLAPDTRGLNEVLDADNSEVVGAGLTHAGLADRLDDLLSAALACYGTPTRLGGLDLVYREAMGRIPCPFADGVVFAKGEVEASRDGAVLFRFTPLSVHLIREHGFYQGRGGRYRMEPVVVARVLGLV